MGYERDLCWTFLSEILFGSMIIPHVLDIHAHDEVDIPLAGTGTHKSRVGNAHRQRPGSRRTTAVGRDRPEARAGWDGSDGSAKCAAYVAATSAPLADDGFRQRLAFDGNRLIGWVVVVDVEGWVGQAGDEASRHQSLIKLVARLWRLIGCGGLGAFRALDGRRSRSFRKSNPRTWQWPGNSGPVPAAVSNRKLARLHCHLVWTPK